MPELRFDPWTGDLIFLAKDRAGRPMTIFDKSLPCPFCPENAHLAAEELFRSTDGRIRIIKNLYPLVDTNSQSAYGYHDVVIDTDIHSEGFEDFCVCDIHTTLSCILRRVRETETDVRIKYVQVFKNRGINGGASVEHSHWQIASLPAVPVRQQRIAENARLAGHCIICDMIKLNIVYENSMFSVYCPETSRFPYEMAVAPKRHEPSFSSLGEDELYAFAEALKAAVSALCRLLTGVDYNICFQTSSINTGNMERSTHFYAEVIPRIGYFAGFEIATGCYTCSLSPDDAARKLKAVL